MHFAFLTYSLLFLFDRWAKDHPIVLHATRELLVIRGGCYALIALGQFAAILLDYHDTWQSRRAEVMRKLSFQDHPPQNRCSCRGGQGSLHYPLRWGKRTWEPASRREISPPSRPPEAGSHKMLSPARWQRWRSCNDPYLLWALLDNPARR